MTEQSTEQQRVRDTIGPVIFAFMREWLVSNPEFVIRDLHDYVARQVEIAPASPQRILQLMRREGHFNYEVTNRRKSQYHVTAVYSPPCPEKTPAETGPSEDDVPYFDGQKGGFGRQVRCLCHARGCSLSG
jgi:hypothetical protein